MSETQQVPNNQTQQAPPKIRVKGPDNKIYTMPAGTTKEQALGYFKRKGITGPSAKPQSRLQKQMAERDKESSNIQDTGLDFRGNQLLNAVKNIDSSVATVAPDIGGALGGVAGGVIGTAAGNPMAGRTIGAAMGGGVGEMGRQLVQGVDGDTNLSKHRAAAVEKVMKAGALQAGLQYGGDVLGGGVFKVIDKIPHATIKNGIKLSPADMQKMPRWIEEFLSNAMSSSGIMKQFKAEQLASIKNAGKELAGAFSKFDGTTEQFGTMLQKTLETFENTHYLEIAKKHGQAVADAFAKDFKTSFIGKLANSGKPEAIAGLIRSKASALEDARELVDLMAGERKKDVLGASRTVFVRDMLNETLTKSIDPLKKVSQEAFKGANWTAKLNEVTEEKLKILMGQSDYKSLMDFTKTVQNIDGGEVKSWIGRLFNLGAIYHPSFAIAGKMGMLNVAAKIMMNPEGAKAYEQLVRATAAQAPRAIHAAREIIVEQMKKADAEYQKEVKEVEEERMKDKK